MKASAAPHETAKLFPLAGRRVWVAGHRGMVGSALVRRLQACGVETLTVERETLDLRDAQATLTWVKANAPEMIFIAAARVGGIDANARFPADFIGDNLAINLSAINAAAHAGVAKLMVLGSSCIYPRLAPQPMQEASLLTGPIEPTNLWYAVAKISALKLAEAYRLQHGRDFISAMPTNLYGPGDRFDETRGHVIPALMIKARRAVTTGAEEIEVWGSGAPLREFLHVDDCADALIFLAERYSGAETINIGSGTEVCIRDLAERICRLAGFKGQLRFDASRPDGAPRKLLDAGRLRAMGWRPKIAFDEGLRGAYEMFLRQSGQVLEE
jgi:GDP-L-fucose synthase